MNAPIALPAGVCLQLVAEGAANIVYRIILPEASTDPPASSDLSFAVSADSEHTPPPTEVDLPLYDIVDERLYGRLLRLRKALPWTSSIAELHQGIHSTISPLFDPDQLVAHDLAVLPSGLIAECNAQLKASEQAGKRPEKRHGVYLELDEPYGLLVTDMSANETNGEVLVEVKPKWLVQSPTAPRSAIRCRTCALREMRLSKSGREEHAKGGLRDFCPFDLASKEQQSVAQAVQSILEGNKSAAKSNTEVKRRLIAFFLSTPILPRLAELQAQLDPIGVLHTTNVSVEVCVAMTLRDCTLFLKLPSTENEPVQARLGDLDIKNADAGKLEYWQKIEQDLIHGGWYGGESYLGKSICRLSR